jgi:hypothetical protein
VPLGPPLRLLSDEQRTQPGRSFLAQSWPKAVLAVVVKLRCNKRPNAYSITSSASDSKLSENLIPSALAVLRLITNSNLVGCRTGSSAGLAPLRTFAV